MDGWWNEEEEEELLEWLEEEVVLKNREDSDKKETSDDVHWLDQLLKNHTESKDIDQFTPQEKQKKRILNLSGSRYKPEFKKKGKIVVHDWPNLMLLSLGNNLITELVVKNLPELKYLTISHNLITKVKIENCPQLTDLYTHHNQLTDEGFPDLRQFPKLEYCSYYDPNYQPKKPS